MSFWHKKHSCIGSNSTGQTGKLVQYLQNSWGKRIILPQQLSTDNSFVSFRFIWPLRSIFLSTNFLYYLNSNSNMFCTTQYLSSDITLHKYLTWFTCSACWTSIWIFILLFHFQLIYIILLTSFSINIAAKFFREFVKVNLLHSLSTTYLIMIIT